MIRRLILMTAAFALCASVAQANPFPDDAPPTVEKILGARVDAQGVTLRVVSSGCTRKESFRLKVRGSRRHATVKALRIRPDYCRAMYHPVEFTWTRAELGIGRFADIRVLNPRQEDAGR